MCGIFGYVGRDRNAADLVLRGLKKLEYRGYDSWGVAVGHRDRIVLEKRTGKIGDAAPDLPPSAIGIGHTRWATHGGVTEPNAHPHLDCAGRLALIHNGIVSNYRELRAPLVRSGHRFHSETDTEVVAHLIEECLAATPAGPEQLVTATMTAFSGACRGSTPSPSPTSAPARSPPSRAARRSSSAGAITATCSPRISTPRPNPRGA